jgi:hypothetical protein
VASFLPRPSCHRGKSRRYPLNWRLGGPSNLSGHFGEEKNRLHLQYIVYLVNFFSFYLLRPLLFQSSIFCLIRCPSFSFQCFLCYLSFLFLTFVLERGVMYVLETQQLHSVINQQFCLHASRHVCMLLPLHPIVGLLPTGLFCLSSARVSCHERIQSASRVWDDTKKNVLAVK